MTLSKKKAVLYKGFALSLLLSGLLATSISQLVKAAPTVSTQYSKLTEAEQKVWLDYQVNILGKELAVYNERARIHEQTKTIPLADRKQSSEYQDLQQKLNIVQQKIDLLVKGFELFPKQATTGSETLAAAEVDIIKNTKLLTNSKAAEISTLVLADRLELILLAPNAPPIRRTVKVSKSELDAVILRMRQGLASPSGETLADSQQLYKWLVASFEPELQSLIANKTVETLLFSPDGNLRLIPMATLHDGKQYLIERIPVANVERLSTIGDSSTTSPKMLAVGMSKTVTGFPDSVSLPGVGEEVRSISQLYSGEMLLDEQLTKKNLIEKLSLLKAGNIPLILHIGTSVYFGSERKSTSIQLYRDKLSLEDFKALDLRNVTLLTLSTCESIGSSSGLEFSAIAEATGAQSVLGSLWNVGDNSTTLLMQQFYKNLKSGMSRAKALQQAQIALLHSETEGSSQPTRGGIIAPASPKSTLNKFSDPFYWAPFILIGDWR